MPEKGQLVRTDDRMRRSPDGEAQIVRFDEVMHFGRGEELKDYQARETPGAFRDAAFAVQFFHPNANGKGDTVSRNHFLMYPPGVQGGLGDGFGIRDLNSLNGTYLNGGRLEPGELVSVSGDDVVSMVKPGDVDFRFERVSDAVNDHHALMVAHPGWNLRGVTGDAKDLKGEIEKRGFRDNIRMLLKRDATTEKILAMLEHIRLQVTRNSTFVFHFSGHGSRQGEICVEPGSGRGRLEAQKVYNLLEQFRGKVLLILDGCYTDMFVVDNMPDNVAVVGHAGKAYEGPSMTARPSEGGGGIVRGYTTRAIVRALRSDPHRVRVPDLVERVQQDPKVQVRQRVIHKPARRRSTVTLGSETPH